MFIAFPNYTQWKTFNLAIQIGLTASETVRAMKNKNASLKIKEEIVLFYPHASVIVFNIRSCHLKR